MNAQLVSSTDFLVHPQVVQLTLQRRAHPSSSVLSSDSKYFLSTFLLLPLWHALCISNRNVRHCLQGGTRLVPAHGHFAVMIRCPPAAVLGTRRHHAGTGKSCLAGCPACNSCNCARALPKCRACLRACSTPHQTQPCCE